MGASPADAWFQGASEDLSRVVFDEAAQLTPEAPSIPPVANYLEPNEPNRLDLYESSGGVVRLVTFLPDGTPVRGSLVYADEPETAGGPTSAPATPEMFTHAVSADGSRVFFYAQGDLYVRVNAYQAQSPVSNGRCVGAALACTVQVDASQAGGPGGGGVFMWASNNGSRVFFTDEASVGLTADTVPGSGKNLYEYDVETGVLTDLTAAAQAGVLGVSGVSEDGSYVYFGAEGALTGEQENSHGAKAEAGKQNLYVVHDAGEPVFVATIEEPVAWDAYWDAARVSSSGRFIAFDSPRSLTGYNNEDANYLGKKDSEIFLYDAVANSLSCVSCDPEGQRPITDIRLRNPNQVLFGGGGPFKAPGYLQRHLSDDGRVFFDTANALLPRASDGQSNVYEYEDGELRLISAGTSNSPSYFYEASPSGNDVFFVSAQDLPPGEQGNEYKLYDARVDGGFAEAEALSACSEEDCKGALTASPVLGAPSSQTFVGQGNPATTLVAAKPIAKKKAVKCGKGRKLEHKKCVKGKSKRGRAKVKKSNRGAGR